MNKKSRLRIWLVGTCVAFALGITILKAIYNEYLFNWKGEEEVICRSAEQAETKGVLVCRLPVSDPKQLPLFQNQPLIISAWTEERHRDSHWLVWFPTVTRIGGYNICVSTQVDQEVRVECPSLPMMIGASSVGDQTLYYFRSDHWDNRPINVRIGTGPMPRDQFVSLTLANNSNY